MEGTQTLRIKLFSHFIFLPRTDILSLCHNQLKQIKNEKENNECRNYRN